MGVITRYQRAKQSAVTDSFTAQSWLRSFRLVLTRQSASVEWGVGVTQNSSKKIGHRSSGQQLAAAVMLA